MLVFPTLRINDKHKFVPLLKRFLNELVQPSPNLPLNDVVDEKTIKAVRAFKLYWRIRIAISDYDDKNHNEITLGLWAMIGRALSKDRLLQELRNATEYEVRSLLLGMDYSARLSPFYSAEMEKCDAKIAALFGGKNAIAAANGFDPDSLAIVKVSKQGVYNKHYRGDEMDTKNNLISPGHLSESSMHLYGSTDGTRFGVNGNTFVDLYIPDGFRESKKHPFVFNRIPGPKAASLDFYYKKLGNYEDVTLMVSHIKDFKVIKAGDRWYIGQIGGVGGKDINYIHSHLDLFEGDVGMTGKRIRIPFAKAFC